jgi:hypothetical protein
MTSLPQDSPAVVDLAADATRQVIVDREAGQYLGHVSTVLLEDRKTMLIVYPKGHGKGPIVLKRSGDGGKTWSPRLSVPESWAGSLETPTIHGLIDPKTKRKRLIVWSGLYPARLAFSENDGKTWSELKAVGDWGGIVVMGSVAALKNGDYAAWFHDDGRFFAKPGKATSPQISTRYTSPLEGEVGELCEPGEELSRSPRARGIPEPPSPAPSSSGASGRGIPELPLAVPFRLSLASLTPTESRAASFTLYQTLSHDGGMTWEFPKAIWSGSELNLCEPGVIRSPSGKQIAILLRENRRTGRSYVMTSNDEGKTWSTPRPMSWDLTGDRHTLRYARDGRLVCVFRNMNDDAWKGDFVAWVGSYEDMLNGAPGRYRVRLLDNQDSWDCGYPGLESLRDGTFVATTYGRWVKDEEPFIVSVRLRLGELGR